jgi:hypothetical protein
MLFLLFFIIALAAVAYGLEWLIEQPGSLTLDFAGYQFEASIPVAVAGLLLVRGRRPLGDRHGAAAAAWPLERRVADEAPG